MQNPKDKIYVNRIIAGFTIIIIIVYKWLDIFKYENPMPSYYYVYGPDPLPSAEDPSFSPNSRSIFFHETSYRGVLTARQACAVEAAARAHPQWQVYVLFSSPVTHQRLHTSCLADLLKLHNINFARVHLAQYSNGTIAQYLLQDLEKSRFPIHHSADILRILTLNKWGGIYLDTDMIVVRSLESLPLNWVVKQGLRFITSGIMSFAKDELGSNITGLILKEIFKSFDPYDWSVSGSRSVQKVIRRMCPNMTTLDNCNGLTMYPYDLFYPLHYKLWKLYFEGKGNTYVDLPYSFQIWNFLSKTRNIMKHTPYKMLATKYCPLIFEKYSDEFGI